MIAVSSIPALAQIRDLRARKFNCEDIQQILAALPGQAILVGLADSIQATASIAAKNAVDAAIKDLRAELAGIKRTTQDSEVVVRQSLANILFLIDKFGRDLQFHMSEERIASNKRDLHSIQYQQETLQLPTSRTDNKGLLSIAATLCRRLSAALFSR
ncbi:MAG: hypothetical protein O3C49_07070 [Proteobacteria bacterium]|nr:hypothetical protein [Pseudomonadota bacterium]